MARSRRRSIALVALIVTAAACTPRSSPSTTLAKQPSSPEPTVASPTTAVPPTVDELIEELFVNLEPAPERFVEVGELLEPNHVSAALHRAVLFEHQEPGLRTVASPIGFNQNREVVVRTPPGYDPGRAWPLIVMYHTWGGEAELIIDRLAMLLGDEIDQFIVAAPDDYRQTVLDAPPPVSSEHVAMWRTIRSRWHIDADRTYLAGYSLGGDTVITMTALHPGAVAGGLAMAAGLAFPSDVDGLLETFLPQIGLVPMVHSYGSEDDLNIPGLNFRPQDITLAEQNELLDGLIGRFGLHRYTHVRLDGIGHTGAYPEATVARGAFASPRPSMPTEFSHTFRYIHQADAYWVEGHEWHGDAWLTPWPEVDPVSGESDEEALTRTIFGLMGTIVASAQNQKITVTTTKLSDITVWLHDEVVDLDRPVAVTVNGVEVFNGTIKPSSAVALVQAHRTRDFDRLRYAGIRVNPNTGEAHVVTPGDSYPSLVRGITL